MNDLIYKNFDFAEKIGCQVHKIVDVFLKILSG